DAYKKTEIDADSGMGIFSLTAGITDRAEAIEILHANTVWCRGLDGFRVHLSANTITEFRRGHVIAAESLANGTRGNYLVSCGVELTAGATSSWQIVADTARDQVQIAAMRRHILDDSNLEEHIQTALRDADQNLRRYVASADGVQVSGQPESWCHHFANVLFNIMRGGVFAHNYDVPRDDLVDFLHVRQGKVAARHSEMLSALPDTITIQDLSERAHKTGDADFERLCLEYLPLHFGRRHGDPSRPWNQFSIKVHDDKGQRALNYEGNWRDIFQNWEALSTAFPGFLPNLVAKFVNASTVDGFNPYRLNREGVDWEVVTPDDPWSNIGYWGDHQIIYLLKLLETWQQHDPKGIADNLAADIFSYAEVPYHIRPYEDILRDPSSTITYDKKQAKRIAARVEIMGTDGKLLADKNGAVHHVNLFEKLLVPALAKISNLVPDAGIWMNTQRPEWNDANNALAGGGVSVVTLCHLRRYLKFYLSVLAQAQAETLPMSTEIVDWLRMVTIALGSEKDLLSGQALEGHDRKRLLDKLGAPYSVYRESVYARGFSGRSEVPVSEVATLCETALEYIEWGINANRRDDGLFHTYNFLKISEDGSAAHVKRLPEMLEGQVAVLTSGFLSAEESLSILNKLYDSRLYKSDERSFILYPERELPGFMARNVVPQEGAYAIPLLVEMLADGDTSVLAPDANGTLRFNGDFSNGNQLDLAMKQLANHEVWGSAIQRDKTAVMALYESVFQHASITGRSGSMYGYEGLGCIYWHMVAKLLLAVQETYLQAVDSELPAAVQTDLAAMYYKIRSGIGYKKSVSEYGAFPTDPYSHTPSSGGAKQPGMTGQVKEEILTRRGELGLRIEAGNVRFEPTLIQPDEFLGHPEQMTYFDLAGETQTLELPTGSLAFTICQVPVIYEMSSLGSRIRVTLDDGTSTEHSGESLGKELSAELFGRTGRVKLVSVAVPAAPQENV
ncbi:MAG: hypothetical protein ACI8S7_001173, partial [Candidatus Krumholzibacteriia bacterium]